MDEGVGDDGGSGVDRHGVVLHGLRVPRRDDHFDDIRASSETGEVDEVVEVSVGDVVVAGDVGAGGGSHADGSGRVDGSAVLGVHSHGVEVNLDVQLS